MKNAPPLLSLESPKGFYAADGSVESGQMGSCDLHIHFASGVLTAAIRERSTRKYLAAECILVPAGKNLTLPEQLRTCLESSRLPKLASFRNTRIAVANTFATLLPAALFRAGDEQSTLDFSVTRNDLVAGSIKLNGYGIQLIYGIQPELQALLLQLFPGASIIHAMAPVLEYQALSASSSREPVVHLIVHPDLMTVIASQGKKLLFANSFQTKDSEEAAYYALFALGQLDTEPMEVQCTLSGTSADCEELRSRLLPYVPALSPVDQLGFANMSRMLGQIHPSNLLPALSIELCA